MNTGEEYIVEVSREKRKGNPTDVVSYHYDGIRIDMKGNRTSLKGIETCDIIKPYEVYEIENFVRQQLTENPSIKSIEIKLKA